MLNVIEEKEPDLKAKFYLTCANLKAELQMYKELTNVKKEIQMIEEALADEEEEEIV